MSASNDFTIKIWDLAEKKCNATLTDHHNYVLSLLLLKNGIMLSGSMDQTIKV